MRRAVAGFALLLLSLGAWAQTYTFGVLPQRSPTLTAQYWNPILEYAGRKAGVRLELATRRTAQDYSAAEARGEFDFVYNNHLFAPSHAAAGYRVFARMAGPPISGQIVVAADSPLNSLQALAGREVGFPSRAAFVAYAVPMAELARQNITVTPVFGGNQEGIMAQLRAGAIAAAGVNSRVMKEYGAREGFAYRVLWNSEPHHDLPVAAHPRVAEKVVAAVRQALLDMAADAEGQAILKTSANLIKQAPPHGFVAARDDEYLAQREIYRLIAKLEAR